MSDQVYDGYFNLSNKEDGLYITLSPPTEQGKKIEIDDIMRTLDHKKIRDYDYDLLVATLRTLREEKEIKLSEAVIVSTDETMEINISSDRLHAYVRLFSAIGEGEALVKEDILSELEKRNIAFGIDHEAIERLIEEKIYCKDIEIAKGLAPVEGKNGRIEYLFETQKKIKPHMNEDGTMDYHKLNIITNVKQGDALAKLIPEEEGIPGKNIFDQDIPPAKVKPEKLFFGKNTKVKEGTLYALTDGQVKIDDGKVIVLNYLEISGNIDNSTGDIEFLGTVLVRGNVLTGYTIKAKGDVEVSGVVEGAFIEAEGNIILHRGIQGMDRAVIKAGGNVMAKYIENSNVTAGGCVHSDAILHSDVACKGEVVVEGRKGLISGGSVRSGIEIRAKVIGSHMETITNLDVGVDPAYMDELNQLQKDVKSLLEEEVKLTQIITLLSKRKNMQGSLDDNKKEMLVSATRSKIFVSNKLKNNQKRLEELTEELSHKNQGKIKVIGNIHSGVRVSIGNVKYYVREPIKYCVMYQDGADIKVTNL